MNSSAHAGIATEATASPPGASALLEQAKALWGSARGLTHDHLQLAALETRLAGQSLVAMIIAGVVGALLLVSAWLGLIGVGVLRLIDVGVVASVAILSAVAANLLVVLILYGLIRRRSQDLRFAATVRSLRPVPILRQVVRGRRMHSGIRDVHSGAELRSKITDTERIIVNQHADVRLRAATLDGGVRRQLTSPSMLFLAASAGFIAERILKTRRAKRAKADDAVKARSASGGGLLEGALKVITLFRAFRSIMPAAATGFASEGAPSGHSDSATPRQPAGNGI